MAEDDEKTLADVVESIDFMNSTINDVQDEICAIRAAVEELGTDIVALRQVIAVAALYQRRDETADPVWWGLRQTLFDEVSGTAEG